MLAPRRGARLAIPELRLPPRGSSPINARIPPSPRKSGWRKKRSRTAGLSEKCSVCLLPNRSRPDLIFRSSPRFVSGDRLVRAEECGGSDLFPPRELLGDRFQIFFVESHATDFYGAIGLDEENRRNA